MAKRWENLRLDTGAAAVRIASGQPIQQHGRRIHTRRSGADSPRRRRRRASRASRYWYFRFRRKEPLDIVLSSDDQLTGHLSGTGVAYEPTVTTLGNLEAAVAMALEAGRLKSRKLYDIQLSRTSPARCVAISCSSADRSRTGSRPSSWTASAVRTPTSRSSTTTSP